MISPDAKRCDRVAERIRAELMALLLRGDLRDPGAKDCFVTAVKVSPDLRHARIYVRLSVPDASEERGAQLVEALSRAAGFLRQKISPRLQLRYQPELRFYWDDGIDQAARVEHLLEEIRQEEIP